MLKIVRVEHSVVCLPQNGCIVFVSLDPSLVDLVFYFGFLVFLFGLDFGLSIRLGEILRKGFFFV